MTKFERIALVSFFITFALILSYMESIIPFNIIPGIKIGLPNIIIIFALYKLGIRDCIIISLSRILIISFLFTSVVSLMYSLVGGFISLTTMILLKKFTKLSKITISIIGGVSHNFGQIIVAIILMGTKQLILYFPVLLFSGLVAGGIIGIIASMMIEKVKFRGELKC